MIFVCSASSFCSSRNNSFCSSRCNSLRSCTNFKGLAHVKLPPLNPLVAQVWLPKDAPSHSSFPSSLLFPHVAVGGMYMVISLAETQSQPGLYKLIRLDAESPKVNLSSSGASSLK